MEAHSELFLLLPESGNCTSAFLLCDQKKEKGELERIIYGIGKVCDFFDYERCAMLYDSLNRDAFDRLLQEVDVADDYPNLATTFLVLISKWEDWRDAPKQSAEDNYTFERCPVMNDSFCEAAKRLTLHNEETTYLLVNASDYKPDDGKACLCCEIQDCVYDHVLEVCKLDIKDIHHWFTNHRRPVRSYLSHKEKHGESGKAARKSQKHGDSVGVLLCKDEEAEKLLHTAIGKSPLCKKLFCYDEERQKYMQFMNAAQPGIKGEYHAFHIEGKQFRPDELWIKKKIGELRT